VEIMFLLVAAQVIPDDIDDLMQPVLNYRMWLSREAEIEGVKISDLVRDVVDKIPLPGIRAVGTAK